MPITNKDILCYYALIGIDSTINDIEKIINHNIDKKEWDESSIKVLKLVIKGHINKMDAIYPSCKETWDDNDSIKTYEKIKKRVKKLGVE